MRRKYLRADLARDLGLTRSSVTKLAARGMPTTNLRAAQEWRRLNLDPSWVKRAPARQAEGPPPAAEPIELDAALLDELVAAALAAAKPVIEAHLRLADCGDYAPSPADARMLYAAVASGLHDHFLSLGVADPACGWLSGNLTDAEAAVAELHLERVRREIADVAPAD